VPPPLSCSTSLLQALEVLPRPEQVRLHCVCSAFVLRASVAKRAPCCSGFDDFSPTPGQLVWWGDEGALSAAPRIRPRAGVCIVRRSMCASPFFLFAIGTSRDFCWRLTPPDAMLGPPLLCPQAGLELEKGPQGGVLPFLRRSCRQALQARLAIRF